MPMVFMIFAQAAISTTASRRGVGLGPLLVPPPSLPCCLVWLRPRPTPGPKPNLGAWTLRQVATWYVGPLGDATCDQRCSSAAERCVTTERTPPTRRTVLYENDPLVDEWDLTWVQLRCPLSDWPGGRLPAGRAVVCRLPPAACA